MSVGVAWHSNSLSDACQLVKMLSKSVSVDLSGDVRGFNFDLSKHAVLNTLHVRGLSALFIRVRLFNWPSN